jgi:hypothetical protein
VLSGDTGHLKLGIVGGLGIGAGKLPDRRKEAAAVEPVDPFEGPELDRRGRAVEAIDGLDAIVVAVADAADGGLDACLGKALGILDRDILHTAIPVVFGGLVRFQTGARSRRSGLPTGLMIGGLHSRLFSFEMIEWQRCSGF